jgi:hypothetical protein
MVGMPPFSLQVQLNICGFKANLRFGVDFLFSRLFWKNKVSLESCTSFQMDPKRETEADDGNSPERDTEADAFRPETISLVLVPPSYRR